MSASSPLPIDAVLPQVRAALAGHGGAVLQAAPGAGKTTRVPLALLREPWLKGQRILMLEPRRLATRAAARFMAATLGEKPGETVGFRVRLESQVSARTRIEVVTEGILTRRLQHDPALEGVGLVIFDEFHERSLDGDLGLALTLESQGALRPDLKILVMSATLDGAAVAALLGDVPVVASEGRAFPVETRYVPADPQRRFDADMAALIRRALRGGGGQRAGRSCRAKARSGGWPRCWQNPACPPTSAFIRSTARYRPRNRTRRSGRRARARARSCWPPPSPRPASPSRASASWWMAARSGRRASIPAPA